MSKVRGRLPNSRTGTVEIVDGMVILKEEKGFFIKSFKEVTKFPIIDTYSTSIEEKVSQFKGLNKLKVEYKKSAEILETTFFSNELNGLKVIKAAIDDNINSRAREEAARRKEWQSHIHQIKLVIDIIDNVYQILISLSTDQNWVFMLEKVNGAEGIIKEMSSLGVVAPVIMDTRGLGYAITNRNAKQIKDEVSAILSVAHRDSERLANYDGTQSFNLELYEIFIKSYTILWDLYLGEVREIPTNEENIGKIREIYSMLDHIQVSHSIIVILKEVEKSALMISIMSEFDELKRLFRKSLMNLDE